MRILLQFLVFFFFFYELHEQKLVVAIQAQMEILWINFRSILLIKTFLGERLAREYCLESNKLICFFFFFLTRREIWKWIWRFSWDTQPSAGFTRIKMEIKRNYTVKSGNFSLVAILFYCIAAISANRAVPVDIILYRLRQMLRMVSLDLMRERSCLLNIYAETRLVACWNCRRACSDRDKRI